ncbi:hypothetical protein NX059_003296 [Plenodomus lindquistii]|nr:hypothetical protein NX059_003296 [Plenodomus lindquistii]
MLVASVNVLLVDDKGVALDSEEERADVMTTEEEVEEGTSKDVSVASVPVNVVLSLLALDTKTDVDDGWATEELEELSISLELLLAENEDEEDGRTSAELDELAVSLVELGAKTEVDDSELLSTDEEDAEGIADDLSSVVIPFVILGLKIEVSDAELDALVTSLLLLLKLSTAEDNELAVEVTWMVLDRRLVGV